MKRINPLTSISDIEVENKINILNKQFHFPIKDSIVKNILELHGARYGVDSKVGEGSTFWFELKIVEEEQA